MTPDPEYTIRAVTVYRLVGPDGKELEQEDDHGTYPWDFYSYEDAFTSLLEATKLPFHGPLTLAEQLRAERNRQLYEPMAKMYERKMWEMLERPSPFIPANSNKTITFVR